MQRESGVAAAKHRYKVIFEGADRLFSCIVVVQVGWDELILDLFCSEKLFDEGGAFVVEYLHRGLEASLLEIRMHRCHGTEEFLFGSCFDGAGEDCIGVMVITDHDILHPPARSGWKTACLVGE